MADAVPAARGRDYRLDFFRGIALIFIFIDHIPDNALSYLTLRSFAFCDAAEVFIFISGYTAALVYSRSFEKEGSAMGVARIYRRVWQLYVAHLFLFMIFNAEVAYTLRFHNNPLFADELQVGDYLDMQGETFIRVLLLQFQPTLLNILPLYIALLLVLPFFIMGMRRNLAATMLASVALYTAAYLFDWNMPGFPEGRHWYFNPFAWQLLFVIAAGLGFSDAAGRRVIPRRTWIVALAVGIVVVAATVRFSWTLHEVFPRIPLFIRLPEVWFGKTDLPPARLLSILALALVVSHFTPRDAAFMTSRAGWLVVLCGQNSLIVFCLTIVLDVLANLVLSLTGGMFAMQLLVNAVGVLIMLGVGVPLAWFKAGGKIPTRPGVMAVP